METIGRVWQVPLDHPIVPEKGEQPEPWLLFLGTEGEHTDCGALVSVMDLVAHGAVVDDGRDISGTDVRCTRLPHADGPHCSHGTEQATIWGGE